MVGEGEQRLLGHGVDRIWSGRRFDVKHIWGPGVLGTGTRPQQALRPGAASSQFLPTRLRSWSR
jgi:hypothetical protein